MNHSKQPIEVTMKTMPMPEQIQEINSLEQVIALYHEYFGNESTESYVGLYMKDNMPVYFHRITKGLTNQSTIHPREAFQPCFVGAIPCNQVIFFRNNPSGSPHFTPEDEATTKSLHQAGNMLGVKVIAHLIIPNHSSRTSTLTVDEDGILSILHDPYLQEN